MSYDYIWNINSEAVQSGVPRTDREISTDIVSRLDTEKKVHYVFFNTGIEMQATLKHLDYLEDRYGITIEHIKHDTPIPIAVKKYGYPFLSKKFSDYIDRLQKHGFQWEDGTYEELEKSTLIVRRPCAGGAMLGEKRAVQILNVPRI